MLTIFSKKDQQEHPSIKKIPYSLWSAEPLFNSSISEFALSCMGTPTTELFNHININTYHSQMLGAQEKKCCLIAIACAHEYVQESALLKIAKALDIAKQDLFSCAAALGYLPLVRHLLPKVIGRRGTIAANNFHALTLAMLNNQLHIVVYLIKELPSKDVQKMVSSGEGSVLTWAAKQGYLEFAIYLMGQFSSQSKPEDSSKCFYIMLKAAAIHGHLAFVEFLVKTPPLRGIRSAFAADKGDILRMSAVHGHLRVFDYLTAYFPDNILEAIKINDYATFALVAANGHLLVLNHLMKLLPSEDVPRMVMAQGAGCDVLCSAVRGGHLPIIEHVLAQLTPSVALEAIAANNYKVFYLAAQNGHLPIIQCLVSWLIPEYVPKMLGRNKCEAFREAMLEGHIAVIEYLLHFPSVLSSMGMHPHAYQERTMAFATERLGALKNKQRVFERAYPHSVFDIENANESTEYFYILTYLIRCNDVSLIDEILWLLRIPSIRALMEGANHDTFCVLVSNPHLSVIKSLVPILPSDKVAEMIAMDGYAAFHYTKNPGVLNYLIEQLPERAREHITSACNEHMNALFEYSTRESRKDIINDLLKFPFVFAYAESHVYEYEYYTAPFVTEKLLALRNAQAAFEENYPNGVFTIEDGNEATLYFYIIRSLIRRNAPSLLEELRGMINIPSVKVLLHKAVTPRQENELLRLALARGHSEVAQLLFTVPAVNTLAAQHNYYQEELRNGVDARALAEDRESSMRALSTGEQKRLQRAIDHYEPQLKALTTRNIINTLRNTLVARYKAHPAEIVDDNHCKRSLPMNWANFNALSLSKKSPEDGGVNEHERALNAYYQHKDHTAFRYLLMPNPWMHNDASYVCINEAHTYRWSTFEDYQPLIAMLFLAATDGKAEPCDGFTLETRLEHFIDELAHIGRAHNWDERRVKVDAEGNPLLDEFGECLTEEYDHLEGDRPSCFSGVKKRLFQSVLGHPLLLFLTFDIVEQKLNELVREHFKAAINDVNREKFEKAWNDVQNDELEHEERQRAAEILKELNLSPEQQHTLLQTLAETLTLKYGAQFSDDPSFTVVLLKRLMLDERDKSAAHATQFASTNWAQCLQRPAQKTPVAEALSTVGVFSTSSSELIDAGEDMPLTSETSLSFGKIG